MAKNVISNKNNKNNKNDSSISKAKIMLAVELVVLLLLNVVFTILISVNNSSSVISNYTALCEGKADLVMTYLDSTEQILTDYAQSSEILDVLRNPSDMAKVNAVQDYTTKYSAGISNLEGIYVSKWTTEVIAHTNPSTRGLITRKDPMALSSLHNSLSDSKNGLYNAGIIISPASGKQIVSLYKVINDPETHSPLGLVGLGLFTDDISGLFGKTSSLLNTADFSLIDRSTGTYVFASDSSVEIGSEATSDILALCERLGSATADESDIASGINGKQLMYHYNSSRDWVFVVSGKKTVIFASVFHAVMQMFWLFVLTVAIAIVSNREIMKHEEDARKLMQTIEKQEKTKDKLVNTVYTDLLTDLPNRTSFITSLGGISPSDTNPVYFVYFNVAGFRNINFNFGNNSGDAVLVTEASVLRTIFSEYPVYRVGSDEFVIPVSIAESAENYNTVLSMTNKALISLTAPMELKNGNVSVMYRVVVAKATKTIDDSILALLKTSCYDSKPNTVSSVTVE